VNSYVMAVQPGGHAVTRRLDLTLSTLLGSCVAACISDPNARVGGLNHFLLPDTGGPEAAASANGGAYAARYGAYAMEVLINDILKQGGRRSSLQAKIFGGARVIALSAQQTVGERNHAFAVDFLRREGIPVTAVDTGGQRARRVFFMTAENRVLVQTLGGSEAQRVTLEESKLTRAARSAPVSGGIELF
jgi:chemotaxis protein CheD